MTVKSIDSLKTSPLSLYRDKTATRQWFKSIPWWLVMIFVVALVTVLAVSTNPKYTNAFSYIKTGLIVTITTTMISFAISLVMGLAIGLGRLSKNVMINNISTFYVEVVRGIPMLVLIFFIALVIIPGITDGMKNLAPLFESMGFTNLASSLQSAQGSSIPMNVRAVIALSITYAAFLAEIFRGGIQSIDPGQMEAARSQGMTHQQAMRYIVLPQALRNVLPALGNDFISLLKDSSLVSILAVRDITQMARLYSGNTFEYTVTYTTLAVMYLSMTIVLSFCVKMLERKMNSNGRN